MMKSEDDWERDRLLGIEAALKIARDQLIRRNMSKLLFQTIANKLVNFAYDSEKTEAFEVIMEDASAYIKPLSTLKSKIVPCIYPNIFSLHL